MEKANTVSAVAPSKGMPAARIWFMPTDEYIVASTAAATAAATATADSTETNRPHGNKHCFIALNCS